MDTIKRLEGGFFSHCDNDWEHDNKIEIYNLDNPGQGIKIDLKGTLLEELRFDSIEYGDSENRNSTWMKRNKQKAIFIGLGSYNMLDSILQIFLDWADSNTNTSQWDSLILHFTQRSSLYQKKNQQMLQTV